MKNYREKDVLEKKTSDMAYFLIQKKPGFRVGKSPILATGINGIREF